MFPARPVYITDSNGNTIGLAGPNGGSIAANGALDIRGFGAKCDGKQVLDATFSTSTTSTITSATAGFTPADVGKSCACINTANQPSSTRYGTITQYISATQVVATLNNTPATGTNEFIWGTDDTIAINSAFTSASASYPRKTVYFPLGITIFTSTLTVPTGVSLVGSGNTPSAGVPQSMHWTGSTLAFIGSSTYGIYFGNGSQTTIGMSICGLNVDFTSSAQYGGWTNDWEIHIDRCTIARAWSRTLSLAGSCVLENSTVYCQQQGEPLRVQPSDVRVINNYIFGAQTGNPVVHITGADIALIGNHMFRAPDATGVVGDMVLIDNSWGTGVGLNKGNILIANNVFDSCNGSGININITASSTSQAIGIIGNSFFQNDTVTNNTYSAIKLNIASGSVLRALSVKGNVGQGSFNDITKGQYKSFIDWSGVAVSTGIIGATVAGNAFDNCNALYTTGAYTAPNYSAGNVTIAGSGTTVAVG